MLTIEELEKRVGDLNITRIDLYTKIKDLVHDKNVLEKRVTTLESFLKDLEVRVGDLE
jgi:chaperonin cofactor prefoldin